MQQAPSIQSPAPVAATTPSPSCPACGELGSSVIAGVPDHEYGLSHIATYAHCPSCKTAYQFPMPHESSLAAFYPGSYHSMTDGGWLMDARRAMRLRRMNKVLAGKSGTVVDYGCGNGSFLVTAAQRAPQNDYVGFEYSDRFEQTVLADGKVKLIRGTPADLFARVASMQLVIMNHVIEHLPDPGAVVKALFERLEPGGAFDGQTPNADSMEHRLFGLRWSGYHAPRHTVIFSKRGLERLLEQIGFAEIRIRGAFNPAGIAVSLGTLPQRGSAGLVVRKGIRWHALVGTASALMPLDLLSGAPGMIDFCARKPGAHAS